MPRLFALTLSALLALSACPRSTQSSSPQPAPAPQPQTKPTPPTPIAEKKTELGSPPGSSNTWDPSWDALIEKSLPPELLSAQAARAVRSYCPRFAQLSEPDKRAFWAYTFQALAGAEAGLDATANVHHTDAAVNKVDPETHHLSRQAGLLQLKYEDAQRYNCPFDYAADRSLPEHDPNRTILQPQRNLACGINIMQDQIIAKGHPLVTRSSYWATLQPGTAGYRVFAKQMINVPADCRLHQPPRSASHSRAASNAR